MKTMILSGISFFLIFTAVTLNSLLIKNTVNETEKALDSAASLDYSEVYRAFQKKETFISLTVSHEDLTNVENAFAELTAAAKNEDTDEVRQIKSRLRDSLEHLRRLSVLSWESVF